MAFALRECFEAKTVKRWSVVEEVQRGTKMQSSSAGKRRYGGEKKGLETIEECRYERKRESAAEGMKKQYGDR